MELILSISFANIKSGTQPAITFFHGQPPDAAARHSNYAMAGDLLRWTSNPQALACGGKTDVSRESQTAKQVGLQGFCSPELAELE